MPMQHSPIKLLLAFKTCLTYRICLLILVLLCMNFSSWLTVKFSSYHYSNDPVFAMLYLNVFMQWLFFVLAT